MEGERKTMTRMELPLNQGTYNVDGVKIIIQSNKIIVDTGGAKVTPVKQKSGEKKEREESRGILAGATDFALHGLPKKKGGRLF
jgi:uncharacterized protein YbcV (DUF1398 family)